jgi:hypothetical protein
MTIFRSDQRKQLQLGLNTIFGLQYNEWPELWRDIFTVENSEKAYEEEVMQSGLGAASVKPEGAGVEYDDMYETYVARYQHDTIAKAVAITEEAVEDNLYASVGQRIAKALARSMKYTKEMRAANVLNFGFDSNYAGGDGVQLFSTAHPLGGGGTLANTLATPADLSESSLEEAAIQIADWTDERGIPVRAMIKKMIIPTALQFVAARLLMTQYQPDTQNNNINALYKLGTIENGFSVNRYITDPDSWYLKTDVDNGLKHFVRRPLKKGLEGDFETGNLRYKVSERYSQGWSDPRGAWASPGA